MPRGVTKSGPTLTTPVWAADFISRDHLVPAPARLDASAFPFEGEVKVVLTAAAIAGATSLAVSALSGKVPSGTMLYFDAGQYARTTADAAKDATTISVEALPAALESGDDAVYVPAGAKRAIRSGTVIGRTYAEMAAKNAFGPAADTDDEFYLVAFDVDDADELPDVELYRPGSGVKENFLPGFSALSATVLGKVRAAYHCFRGEA